MVMRTASRRSMTLASMWRSASMRALSSYFSRNIHFCTWPSTAVRSGSKRMRMTNEATSVLKKNTPRLVGGHPRHQQAVDRRQDEHEGRDDHHAAEELVEIEQAVAEQRLRDEVDVDDRQDVAERGERHAELGQEVGGGEGDGAEPADEEVLDARLFDARDGAAVFAVELEHRRVQPAEDVAAERHA